MADAFIALTSPVGIVVLAITGAGIYLAVLVSLGGLGERNFSKASKIIFGILSVIMILFGASGIFAIVYPVISQNLPSIPRGFFITLLVILLSIAALFLLILGARKVIINFKSRTSAKHKSKVAEGIKWAHVIVPNENMWGQKMPTYAGIRVDSEETCKGVKAKLKSIVRIRNNGEKETLDLDEINPTNQFLRWSERVKCMLEIVDDSNNEPRLLFQNYRDYKINTGTFEFCIEISKPDGKSAEIKETLEVRKPYSEVKMKWV